jgi:hypothetical protein
MAVLLILALGAAADFSAEVTREVARQECRTAVSDEIIVCGRRAPDERYRLPDRNGPFDPSGNTYSVMRERERWTEGGETGINSCGPVGPGGWTGCLVQQWKREGQQTQGGNNRPKKGW